MGETETEYFHWRRFDGSFHSVCRRCGKIIAYAETEEELAELEKDHICGDRQRQASLE
jgi:hypothetical protein